MRADGNPPRPPWCAEPGPPRPPLRAESGLSPPSRRVSRSGTRRRREAGLTLIEMLVAFALLGLLFALLHDGFSLGQRVWDRATTRLSARVDEVEAVQAMLRERLALAYPAYGFQGDGAVTFEGDAGRLAFDSRPTDAMGPGTYLRFVLEATADGVLELAWRPDTDRRLAAPFQRAPILAGVAGLEIAYFGAARGDVVERWTASWRNQPRPPRLVRLRVRFPPGDARLWPDLVVAPRATVDALCAWDSQTRGCRGRS